MSTRKRCRRSCSHPGLNSTRTIASSPPSFSTGTPLWETGDFDGNGAVSDVGLSLLPANWGGGQAVPEPVTISLLAMGAAGLLLLWRWQ